MDTRTTGNNGTKEHTSECFGGGKTVAVFIIGGNVMQENPLQFLAKTADVRQVTEGPTCQKFKKHIVEVYGPIEGYRSGKIKDRS